MEAWGEPASSAGIVIACRSEFVMACMAMEQIIDLRTTEHCLGVPVREKSHMFGDNKSIIDSAAAPHAKPDKHHNALCFHWVCEAVAGKFAAFHWLMPLASAGATR
jgi:hypothetical protein